MKLETKHFGLIDIDENKIINFEEGLPGFPEDKRFIILSDNENAGEIYHWMQSVDDGEVAFVIFDTFKLIPDYNPLVDEEELSVLGEYNADNLLVYNIAVVPEDVTKTTVNLKAPIVINYNGKAGKQVIVTNEEYSIKHYIFDEIKEEESR